MLKNRFRKYLTVVVDIETGGFDPDINAILEIAITLIEEEKCFGANQTMSSVLYDTGTTTVGTALAGGLASAGCGATDHTKATVSSFHLGGSLTWTF